MSKEFYVKATLDNSNAVKVDEVYRDLPEPVKTDIQTYLIPNEKNYIDEIKNESIPISTSMKGVVDTSAAKLKEDEEDEEAEKLKEYEEAAEELKKEKEATEKLKKEKAAEISAEMVTDITYLTTLNKDTIPKLNTEQIEKLTTAQIEKLTPEQIEFFSEGQLNTLKNSENFINVNTDVKKKNFNVSIVVGGQRKSQKKPRRRFRNGGKSMRRRKRSRRILSTPM